MPKKHADHDAILKVRLPKSQLYALKWSAEADRIPFSEWVRDALNRRCFSCWAGTQLVSGSGNRRIGRALRGLPIDR